MLWGSAHAFPINEHQVMLEDIQRIELYSQALQKVSQGKLILDVGAGTNCLGLEALKHGAKKVIALEKDFPTYNFIQELIKKSKYRDHIELYNLSSFDFDVSLVPDVLVSELLGSVGPEERMIEVFFALKSKYPSIKEFIPNFVEINYAFLFSEAIELSFDNSYNAYANTLDYINHNEGKRLFDLMFGQKFLFSAFEEDFNVIKKGKCTDYTLGQTPSSDFQFLCDIPKGANALSLFFKAYLDQEREIILSNFPGSGLHWYTPYLKIPKEMKEVKIKYRDENNFFFIEWA